MFRNLSLANKYGVRPKIRPVNFCSDPILPEIAKRFSGLSTILLLLLFHGTPVLADTAADLAAAKASFDQVQQTIIARTKQIDPELRGAAWGQYYLALDQLQKMDIHQQMMSRHQQDRKDQFTRANETFHQALRDLEKLLASPGAE